MLFQLFDTCFKMLKNIHPEKTMEAQLKRLDFSHPKLLLVRKEEYKSSLDEDKTVKQTSEKNVEHSVEETIEQTNVEHSVEETIEQTNVEHSAEQTSEKNVEHSVEETMEETLEETMEETMEETSKETSEQSNKTARYRGVLNLDESTMVGDILNYIYVTALPEYVELFANKRLIRTATQEHIVEVFEKCHDQVCPKYRIDFFGKNAPLQLNLHELNETISLHFLFKTPIKPVRVRFRFQNLNLLNDPLELDTSNYHVKMPLGILSCNDGYISFNEH